MHRMNEKIRNFLREIETIKKNQMEEKEPNENLELKNIISEIKN